MSPSSAVGSREKSHASPSSPNTMSAAAIDHFGGPEVLKMQELPIPSLEADEVLIAVHTAGVGSWDAEIRGGWWPDKKHPPKFPLVLGSDGSGTIAAKGSRVQRFLLGDRVYGYAWNNPKGGFYADYMALPADNVALVPKGLSLDEAGGAPVIGLTALQGVDDTLHLKKGERVLIHGASGGVGSAAIQFAKSLGARVYATASGKDGVKLALDLGAEEAIDGKGEDVLQAVQKMADGGFDAIFATVGHNLAALLKTLKRGGRLAYPNGVEPAPKKHSGIKISSYDGVGGRQEFERLNKAIEAGGFRVPIFSTYLLSHAAKAQELAQKGHVIGKVVLRVQS
jgi:NADPH:quinone reductase